MHGSTGVSCAVRGPRRHQHACVGGSGGESDTTCGGRPTRSRLPGRLAAASFPTLLDSSPSPGSAGAAASRAPFPCRLKGRRRRRSSFKGSTVSSGTTIVSSGQKRSATPSSVQRHCRCRAAASPFRARSRAAALSPCRQAALRFADDRPRRAAARPWPRRRGERDGTVGWGVFNGRLQRPPRVREQWRRSQRVPGGVAEWDDRVLPRRPRLQAAAAWPSVHGREPRRHGEIVRLTAPR